MTERHQHIVVLSPDSPSPSEGKAARRQAYQTLLETTERFPVTPVNPQYRVIDHAGLVWGTSTIERKSKRWVADGRVSACQPDLYQVEWEVAFDGVPCLPDSNEQLTSLNSLCRRKSTKRKGQYQ